MKWPIITMPVEREDDIVAVRQRGRSIAAEIGFGTQDQTRIATALSEIARNAYGYAGGGKVEFGIAEQPDGQEFVLRITDRGRGIDDVGAVLEGRYHSRTGLGAGIIGARRLMDRFELDSRPGKGTVVTLAKRLPSGREPMTGPKVAALAQAAARSRVEDPASAMREQNRELLQSLAELAEREEEARRLNRELAETNSGVVALYAELETQAGQLRDAGASLERQVADRTAALAQANERLRAEAIERERIETDLRQFQKMEAVGQLTGGIAHDFNNLLTGIVGPLDLMQNRIRKGRVEGLERYIEMAMSSANRAAALTHRLLAFARRQPLDPKPTDANELIQGMADLLRRTISESIDLRIGTANDDDLWLTLCDSHQLENAILNLAINARDAMPNGGALSIQTCNGQIGDTIATHKPGEMPDEYVCIRVTDTGTGMPPDVIARAFEPFFTTKPLGQGTGLGLSMIYGFARQSEGHAHIESELGRGTSIRLYLPRYRGKEHVAASAARAADVQRGEGKTVLIVEDEIVVRDLVVEALRDLGYRVLQAADGPSGRDLLLTSETIDLLVTDIGLPGLDGRQMVDQARIVRPDLRVLFITGYAEAAAASSGFLDVGMAMITKPFKIATLTSRITALVAEGS